MQPKRLPATPLVTSTFFLFPMPYASYCALAALLALSTTACQKAGVDPATADPGLSGEWHWVSSTGGFTGKQTNTPASTGATITWVFKPDNTYQRVTTPAAGTPLTETGTFSLGPVKSIYSGQSAQALTLQGKLAQTFILEELTSRLVLADNVYDGFKHTYQR
jgi:hypothetical protein